MKTSSTPTVTREDQISFVKIEKLRGISPDDIRRGLLMICREQTLDLDAISSTEASARALTTDDQISYVKVETFRNIKPIKDVHRTVQTVCGSATLSSSTYTRWLTKFRQGKSVCLGYGKPTSLNERTAQIVKRKFNTIIGNTSMEEDETSDERGHSSLSVTNDECPR